MKKLKYVFLGCLCLIVLIQEGKAQKVNFSAGIETVIPAGSFKNFSSFGAGLSLGIEYRLNKKMSLTGQIGFTILNNKIAEKENITREQFNIPTISSYVNLIPIHIGYKYYLNTNKNRFYLHSQLGIHISSSSIHTPHQEGVIVTGDVSKYSLNYSYGLGAGYLLNEKIDLSLKYTTILDTYKNSNYITLGTAYNF